MKTMIVLLVGLIGWSACTQPTTTESPAKDSMELNNRGHIPVDTKKDSANDSTSYKNETDNIKKDSLPR